jgi:hypothetical protein
MNKNEDLLLIRVTDLHSKIKQLQVQNETKYYAFIQETQSTYDDIQDFDLEYLKVQKLYFKTEQVIQIMSSDMLDDLEEKRITALKKTCRLLSTIILKIVDYSVMFFEKIKEMKSRSTSPYVSTDGASWFHFMCQVYINNSGKYNVSTVDFFLHFKKIWHELSDYETCEIAHVTDDMLGGTSVFNIAHNLERWIKSNFDCLHPSEIAIFNT